MSTFRVSNTMLRILDMEEKCIEWPAPLSKPAVFLLPGLPNVTIINSTVHFADGLKPHYLVPPLHASNFAIMNFLSISYTWSSSIAPFLILLVNFMHTDK